jgi:hypothetical protein
MLALVALAFPEIPAHAQATTAAAAAAATQKLESCPSGTNKTYATVATTSALPLVFSSSATGLPQSTLFCTPMAQAKSTWFVKYTVDGGSNWLWEPVCILAPVLGGCTTTTTPPPASQPITAQISWIAPTTDTTGAKLTVPLTYNLYRGPTLAGVVFLKNVNGLSTTDTVTTPGTYWYAVTALNGAIESAQEVAVSAQLSAGKVVSPAPPTGLTIK